MRVHVEAALLLDILFQLLLKPKVFFFVAKIHRNGICTTSRVNIDLYWKNAWRDLGS